MDTKVARRDSYRSSRAPFSWHRQHTTTSKGKVCSFWLSGNCTRNPCRFLHSDSSAPIGPVRPVKRSVLRERPINVVRKIEDEQSSYLRRKKKNCLDNVSERKNNSLSEKNSEEVTKNSYPRICDYWVKGNCVNGEKCKSLHSWSHGNGISMLAQLDGHKKAVTGIILPSDTDKLFSGCKDGTVRTWNCHTGQCVGEFDMGAEVGYLMSEGPWVFAGLTNAIKAWNIQSGTDLTLSVPAGQVYAMAVAKGLLLAGVHDGSVLVWKFNSETSSFEMNALLKGHTGAVVTLTVGNNRLYSGSVDSTIRVWDLDNLQCIDTLNGHSEVVMSLTCWDQFLLSSSLDRTLKVWAATESGELKVTYTHILEHGILALSGMADAENKPILLCSCNDNTVRLYELPSFVERGRIFTREEVRSINIGPGGLFFTGDGTGRVSVWRLQGDSTLSPKST